ncbi:Crn-like protein, partial [Globisporangium splendens]
MNSSVPSPKRITVNGSTATAASKHKASDAGSTAFPALLAKKKSSSPTKKKAQLRHNASTKQIGELDMSRIHDAENVTMQEEARFGRFTRDTHGRVVPEEETQRRLSMMEMSRGAYVSQIKSHDPHESRHEHAAFLAEEQSQSGDNHRAWRDSTYDRCQDQAREDSFVLTFRFYHPRSSAAAVVQIDGRKDLREVVGPDKANLIQAAAVHELIQHIVETRTQVLLKPVAKTIHSHAFQAAEAPFAAIYTDAAANATPAFHMEIAFQRDRLYAKQKATPINEHLHVDRAINTSKLIDKAPERGLKVMTKTKMISSHGRVILTVFDVGFTRWLHHQEHDHDSLLFRVDAYVHETSSRLSLLADGADLVHVVGDRTDLLEQEENAISEDDDDDKPMNHKHEKRRQLAALLTEHVGIESRQDEASSGRLFLTEYFVPTPAENLPKQAKHAKSNLLFKTTRSVTNDQILVSVYLQDDCSAMIRCYEPRTSQRCDLHVRREELSLVLGIDERDLTTDIFTNPSALMTRICSFVRIEKQEQTGEDTEASPCDAVLIAKLQLNEPHHANRWELIACGYAYLGPEVTNNWYEYSALKDSLAYSAHYLQHDEVKMEVFGDSQMIVAAQNGFASIRQTKLQPLAVRVNQIIANFAWISWNHTIREQNKMADLLANVAMNSKSARILTGEWWGNDQVLVSQVAALLDNDIGAAPSKLRNTSLITSLSLATFTSAAEMKASVSDSIDKQKQPLKPAADNPHASGENKPSENTNPATPDETNSTSPQPNSNPKNPTKSALPTMRTGIPVQQTGKLKEQMQVEMRSHRQRLSDWRGGDVVDDFRKEVKKVYADSHLAGITPSDLRIYSNRAAFNEKKHPLTPGAALGTYGSSDSDTIVVEAPTKEQQSVIWLVGGMIENALNTKGVRCRLYRLADSNLGYYDPSFRSDDKDMTLCYDRDQNNRLALSRDMHGFYDGLSVAVLVMNIFVESVSPSPVKDDRYEVKLLVKALDPDYGRRIAIRLKEGTIVSEDSMEMRTCVHVTNPKIFCKCIEWKSKQIEKVWEDYYSMTPAAD